MSDNNDGFYAAAGIAAFLAKAVMYLVVLRLAWVAGSYFMRH